MQLKWSDGGLTSSDFPNMLGKIELWDNLNGCMDVLPAIFRAKIH